MQKNTVILIGGSSGIGKSHLARQLAEHLRMPLTEMDDIRIALQQVAERNNHSELFTFIDNKNFREEYDEYMFTKKLLGVGKVVWKSLDVLISKHIGCNEPVIFEGDSVIPDLLATRDMNNVMAIFIHDDMERIKERQIKRNRLDKGLEGTMKNALFSYTYSEELKRQAEAKGFLTIQASPIETLFERTLQAFEKPQLDVTES